MFFTRPVATALTAVSLLSSLALGAPVAFGEDYEVELVGRSDLKNCLTNCQLTFNVFKPSEREKCIANCHKKYGKKKEKKEEKSTALVKTRSFDLDDEDYLSRSFDDDEVELFGRSDLKNCLTNCQLTFNVFKPSEREKCIANCHKKYGKKKEKKEEKSTALVKTRSLDGDEVELFGRSDLKNCLTNCQLTFNIFKPSEREKCIANCHKKYGKKKEKKEEKSTALVKTRDLDDEDHLSRSFDDEDHLSRSFDDEEVELFGRSDLKNCLTNCQLTFNIFKPSEREKCIANCQKKYGKKKEQK